ncbi:MAG TPA: exosortase/archaeosortase family protein [Syntrophobacteraceae bacterium]|nr:exosortase/archaeosortase family protein [Syntrophobacteraceae bacterium]
MIQDNQGAAPFDDFSVDTRTGGNVITRSRRFAYYFICLFLGVCVFALPLKELISMSLDSEYYSFIPLIFVTSSYLVISGRKQIFDEPAWSCSYGAPVLVFSLAAGIAGHKYAAALGLNDYLCVTMFSFWLYLIGSFILFFGRRTFIKAIFPLGLLLFVIPFPEVLLDKIIDFLQVASYTVTGLIFNALGFFPIVHGFIFKFPELAIEVARQCSGIRSCTALVILSLLCGHLFLRSSLNRILLPIFAVPIAIFKNGVRIVCLTLGAIYVDPRIMSGELHQKGGYPVFVLAFFMLMAIVMVMRKLEKRRRDIP